MNLKQGAMSVEEYEQNFTKLSRFAPKVVAIKEDITQRFVQSLTNGLRGLVQADELGSYATVFRATTSIASQAREEYVRTLILGSFLEQKRKAARKLQNLRKEAEVQIDRYNIIGNHLQNQNRQKEISQFVALVGNITGGVVQPVRAFSFRVAKRGTCLINA